MEIVSSAHVKLFQITKQTVKCVRWQLRDSLTVLIVNIADKYDKVVT